MNVRQLALPLLLAAAPFGQALAQTPASGPTQQQGLAADMRAGSTFSAYGSTIFYQVTGAGTPLVLIHGYPLSGALYQYQQTALANRFQVITLDLPGFGRSSAPVGFGSTALYARYVIALLDHLGISKAIIGGHSMGGIITQEIYREAPGRFSGMILIDTIAATASRIEQGEWTGYFLQASEKGVASYIPTITAQLLTGNTLLNTPAVGGALQNILAEASVAGAEAGAETLAIRPDYTAQLSTISVPTLILEGVYDVVYPFPIAKAIQADVPGSTLTLIPNAGHASIFENPDAANQAISAWATASGL